MSELTSNTDVKMGSDKAFGIVFAVVFGIIAFWPVLWWNNPRVWAILVAAVFLLVAFIKPDLLRPLNRIWFLFGLLLHKIVSPIIIVVLFFLTVTPIALLMRAFGKDVLNQSLEPDTESYWITVSDEHHASSSMRNQF